MSRLGKPPFIIPAAEQESIGLVVGEIVALFPSAQIVVCDNNSTDRTSDVARQAGATVLFERRKGKGNAVSRLLRDVDADCFVMVDGDNTYDLSQLSQAIEVFRQGRYDLMTGDRFAGQARSHFRHGAGNLFYVVFPSGLWDSDSGCVFRLAYLFAPARETFPLVSAEFEIETELTIYAARMRLPANDFPTSVRSRVNSE